MLSERRPTQSIGDEANLAPGQLVKRENRRDLPFGVGSSITLHVILGLVLFAAAFFYVAHRPTPETKSQNVIIQTLVRTQPKITTQPHRVTLKPIPHTEKVKNLPLMAHQLLEPNTRTGHSDAAASMQRKPGATQAQLLAAAAAARTELDQQRALAEAAMQSPVTSTGTSVGTSSSDGDSASGTAVSSVGDGTGIPGGGRSRGGHGAWSERPSAPFGGMGGNLHPDNCTPGRGGFFYHRH